MMNVRISPAPLPGAGKHGRRFTMAQNMDFARCLWLVCSGYGVNNPLTLFWFPPCRSTRSCRFLVRNNISGPGGDMRK